MSLVLYSSSSDSDSDDRAVKRLKPSDDVALPNTRTRLFPHEEGNWALSIYTYVKCSSHLDTMIDDLIEIFDGTDWKRLMELHISLSKTFPIRYHHIESIRKGLEHELAISMVKFSTRIDNVTMLTNEDGSTSFLVFTLDQHGLFSKLIEITDKVLNEHRYPSYYENPCFHISFAHSSTKNREDKLSKDWKDKCQSILKQYQCQPSATTIFVDDIRLKAGRRVYHLTKSSSS